MTVTEQPRDRPYLRYVFVRAADVPRMREIITAIPRKKVLRHINHGTDAISRFSIYVKQQELLMMSLTFQWIRIEKPRYKKAKDRFGWKNIQV